MPGWTPPELARVVGRGPARARCLEVVEAVLAVARRGPSASEEDLVEGPFGFSAEGLGLARGVAGRPEDLGLPGLDRMFFHVGLGMARGFGAELPWPAQPWASLQSDGLGFAGALHRPGRALRLPAAPEAGPIWFAHGQGRAAWFLAAGGPSLIPELLAERRPGLFEGFGLASHFTGGTPREELDRLLRRAGPAAGDMARGRSFSIWLRGLEGGLAEGIYAPLAGLEPATRSRER